MATDHQLTITADARINEVGFNASALPQIGAILAGWLNGQNRAQGYGGESFDQASARWGAWWYDFVRDHRNDRGGAVVVAHGALLMLMLPETCSNPVEPTFNLTHPLFNTAVVKATLQPNGTLTCTEWAGAPIPSAGTP